MGNKKMLTFWFHFFLHLFNSRMRVVEHLLVS
uniref:Uncharacterized protein n=1 Tax=Rhizophora mucronata TaxID=61149 RepID=A0A2P2QK08_RHIMU